MEKSEERFVEPSKIFKIKSKFFLQTLSAERNSHKPIGFGGGIVGEGKVSESEIFLTLEA